VGILREKFSLSGVAIGEGNILIQVKKFEDFIGERVLSSIWVVGGRPNRGRAGRGNCRNKPPSSSERAWASLAAVQELLENTCRKGKTLVKARSSRENMFAEGRKRRGIVPDEKTRKLPDSLSGKEHRAKEGGGTAPISKGSGRSTFLF